MPNFSYNFVDICLNISNKISAASIYRFHVIWYRTSTESTHPFSDAPWVTFINLQETTSKKPVSFLCALNLTPAVMAQNVQLPSVTSCVTK